MTEITMEFMMQHSELRTLHEMDLKYTLELSKFRELSSEEKLQVAVPIVIDGAKWVASDRPLDSVTDIDKAHIVSSDGVLVAKQIRRRKFNIREWNGKDQFSGVEYIEKLYPAGKINKTKEIAKELKVMGDGLKGLEGLAELSSTGLEDLQQGLTEGNAAPTAMNAFNEEPSTTESKPSGLRAEISSQISEMEAADAYSLQKFNRTEGRLIGYITATDKRIEFITTAEPRLENGKVVVSATAPAEVQQAHEQGEKVAKKYLQTETRINVRQAKPGKIQGLVLTIPAGGIVEMTDFLKPGRLQADESNRTLVTQVLSKELYPTILDLYFGSEIAESELTHGGAAAGVVTQKATVRYKTKDGQPTGQQVVVPLLKTSKRRSLFIDSNYFPLRTYETINYNQPLDETQIEKLNVSAFHNLVHGRKNRDDKSKYSLLAPEDANKVSVDAEGKITSTFFARNINEREQITVRPFFDAKEGEPLSDIAIPVKEAKPNAAGVMGNPRFKTVLTTDERVLNDPELSKLASLNNPAFKTIVDASNGALTVERLRELTRRTTTKKPANFVSNEQLIRLRLGLAQHQLDESDITFADTNVDFKQIENSITDIRAAARVAQ